MKRLNKFITAEELSSLRTEYNASGMWLSGGLPMGDPNRKVAELAKKYGLPTNSGIDISTGEFVSPD